MADPRGHGSDIAGIDDVDASLTFTEGRQALAESTARRLITPPLGLFYDRDYGRDVREFLGAGVPPQRLRRLSVEVQREAEKDERIRAAVGFVRFIETETQAIELDSEVDSLRIDLSALDDEGPFRFTVDVSDLTTELLLEVAE